MPILEFLCKDCGRRWDDLVRSAEEAACPDCGSRRAERLISTFAVNRAAGGGEAVGPGPGSCGSCGDPRGPGACSLDD